MCYSKNTERRTALRYDARDKNTAALPAINATRNFQMAFSSCLSQYRQQHRIIDRRQSGSTAILRIPIIAEYALQVIMI